MEQLDIKTIFRKEKQFEYFMFERVNIYRERK